MSEGELSRVLVTWAVTSSALLLIMMALRALVKNRMSPTLRYGLWLLVLVRLLFPGNIGASSASVLNLEIAGERYEIAESLAETSATVEEVVPEMTSRPLPMVLYCTGAALTGLWQLVVNLRFARGLRKCRRLTGRVGGRAFYVAEGIGASCLFGLFSPAIYLTPEVAADPRASYHVLAHEYTHFHHMDHLWAFLRGVCLALHWYNPLVWWAAAKSRRDCELACDAGAVRLLGENLRADYGRTLVSLTTRRVGASDLACSATTVTGGKSAIKERVAQLVRRPRTTGAIGILVTAVCLMAVVCTFTGGEAELAAPAVMPTSVGTEEPEPFPEEFPLPDALKERGLKFLPGKKSTWEMGKMYRENSAKQDKAKKAAQMKWLFEKGLI